MAGKIDGILEALAKADEGDIPEVSDVAGEKI